MKNNFILLSIVVISTMCSPPKPEVTNADTVLVQRDSTTAPEQPLQTEEVTKSPDLAPTSFDKIPDELKNFMIAMYDIEKLAKYIDTTAGCYIIEEGPGVYPVINAVKTTEDLMDNSEFILFMSSLGLPNSYYINQQIDDLCNLPAEGIYFNTFQNNKEPLFTAYQPYMAASGEEMSAEIKAKLSTLNAAVIWQGTINLPTKTGDLNTFDVYLATVNKRILLAAVDTRGCGL